MTIKKSYKGIRFLGLNDDDECPKKGLYFKIIESNKTIIKLQLI
jgi:hypothetical protein